MKNPIPRGIALLASLLLASLTAPCQKDNAIVTFKNPPGVATPNGYSHAAVIDLGNCQMVVLSGQIPLDSNGVLVGKDDLGKQAEQVFLNMQRIITGLGGTMDQLIRIGIYMIDITKIQALRDARNKFINLKNPPASTLVQVSSLFREDVFLEVEATFIIPRK